VGVSLWYALAVDRSKLTAAYGLITTGVFWEFVHRVLGPNRHDTEG